jgi:hypothetical protein
VGNTKGSITTTTNRPIEASMPPPDVMLAQPAPLPRHRRPRVDEHGERVADVDALIAWNQRAYVQVAADLAAFERFHDPAMQKHDLAACQAARRRLNTSMTDLRRSARVLAAFGQDVAPYVDDAEQYADRCSRFFALHVPS